MTRRITPSSPRPSAVRRRTAALLGSAALVAGLAACSEPEPPEQIDGLAVVVGGHCNMPQSNLRGVSVARAEAAVHWEAMLSVVVADGAPFLQLEPARLPVNNKNSVAAEKDRQRNLTYLADAIGSAAAKTPETDLLAALDRASAAVSSAEDPKTVVVVDSGLSTTGALDFTEKGVLDADPAALAAELHEARELPDLSGIDVVLQGMGDTTPSQPRLGQRQRDNLVDIWTAVVEAAGAASVVVERTPTEGEPCEDLPPVSPVPVFDGDSCTVETYELDEGQVAFRPDSADFVHQQATNAVLAPIADRILREGLRVELTGTTADVGDIEGQRTLSLERAEAVSAELQAMGVPDDRMSVEGLGSEFPGYVDDQLPNGDLDEEAAAGNRQVFVTLSKDGAVSC